MQNEAKSFFKKAKKNPAESLEEAVKAILKNQNGDVYSKERDILLLNIGAAQAALWALAEQLSIIALQSGKAYLANPVLEEDAEPEPTPKEPENQTVQRVYKKPSKKQVSLKPILPTEESPAAYVQRLGRSRKGAAYIKTALTKRFGRAIAQKTLASLTGINPRK